MTRPHHLPSSSSVYTPRTWTKLTFYLWTYSQLALFYLGFSWVFLRSSLVRFPETRVLALVGGTSSRCLVSVIGIYIMYFLDLEN